MHREEYTAHQRLCLEQNGQLTQFPFAAETHNMSGCVSDEVLECSGHM